jgi:hypothetical protein
MDRYKSPIADLPDDHMRMVGIISTHWEWIEVMMERAVAEVMQHQPARVQILTANINFHTKCDIILAYARHFQKEDPEQWKKFTTTIEGLKNAYSERNKYVHAKWKMVGSQINLTQVRTSGGKFSLIDEPCPIEDLNKVAHQIVEAGEAFVTLVQPFGLLQP